MGQVKKMVVSSAGMTSNPGGSTAELHMVNEEEIRGLQEQELGTFVQICWLLLAQQILSGMPLVEVSKHILW